MWELGDVVVCRNPTVHHREHRDWFSNGDVGVVVGLDPPKDGAYVQFFVRLHIPDLEAHEEYHMLCEGMHPETHWVYGFQMERVE